jgi:hypothetical protein
MTRSPESSSERTYFCTDPIVVRGLLHPAAEAATLAGTRG